MTLHTHLEIVGTALVLLGLSHSFFNRYFGWGRELAGVSLLTRQIFFVHTFFIALGVVLAGAGSILYADALLRRDPLSRAVLAAMAIFWFCRLLTQLFVYDSRIWRGDRFRTFIHVAFSALWCYIAATYAVASLVGTSL